MKLITSEMLGVELRHNYYIDEHGNIFSEYSNKFLTHERTKNGYLRVEIQGKHYLVHRLVAMAFLGIKSNEYEVNHKDQNPENNDIDNLEWVTHKENINYEPTKQLRTASIARGERCNFSKLTEKEVREIISLLDKYTNSELASMFNVDRKSVYNIRAHKTWAHLFK